jgi:hypothetical protein
MRIHHVVVFMHGLFNCLGKVVIHVDVYVWYTHRFYMFG